MGLKEWLLDHVLGGVLVVAIVAVLGWAWPLIGPWGFALGLSLIANAVQAFYYFQLRKPRAKVVRRYTILIREKPDSHPVAFRVQLERIPGTEEPRAMITMGYLCGVDYYKMILVDTVRDDFSDLVIQEWACPQCVKRAKTIHGQRGDIHDVVKGLALGRFHNNEPSDPPLQAR